MWSSWGQIKWIDQPIRRFSEDQFGQANTRFIVGNRRSYGDSCLLSEGTAFSLETNDNLLTWNSETGYLKLESGATLDQILDFSVPRGWFLPVTPGTKYITLGGAIANDIHGKNHHHVGNFGHFVTELEVLRSNGERIVCSPNFNSDFFSATVGGLGLTGAILSATIRLIPIQSSQVDVEFIQFEGLEEFLDINQDSNQYPYTVAWLDCIARRNSKARSRGIYIRGHHSRTPSTLRPHRSPALNIPFNFPNFALNSFTMSAFNTVFFHKQFKTRRSFSHHYDSFFYPLDGVQNWNRIYGKRGFYQYQFVVPMSALNTLQTILDLISNSGQASFLSVLKTFGQIPSLGLLSFPTEGITLCLDFPNRGAETLALFSELDDHVHRAGGRRYPAKDATLSSRHFKQSYPNLNQFMTFKDPKFSSDFWKRVTEEKQ